MGLLEYAGKFRDQVLAVLKGDELNFMQDKCEMNFLGGGGWVSGVAGLTESMMLMEEYIRATYSKLTLC